VDEWLTRARDAIADAAGVPRGELEVEDDTTTTLLDLARVAAHDGGDRRNAPIVTYLAGRAAERGGDLGAIAAAIRSL
jgi:hypothetical protein